MGRRSPGGLLLPLWDENGIDEAHELENTTDELANAAVCAVKRDQRLVAALGVGIVTAALTRRAVRKPTSG